MIHAKLPASASERWMNCHGSQREINALGGSGGGASYAAAEGTYAHHIAAACLGAIFSGDDSGDPAEWLGNKTVVEGHTIECDQEMVDGVQAYVDDVVAEVAPGDQLWVEVDLNDVLKKLHPDIGGNSDFARYRPSTRELLVEDFKYGAGTFVDAVDNKQLKIYALGVLLATGVPAKRVRIRICQPRIEVAGEISREFVLDGIELLSFAADIVDAAEAANKPDAPLNPGPWCKKSFCPAARTCPALEQKHHEMVKADFLDVVKADPEKLSRALFSIEELKARAKAIEEFAYEQACRGVEIPGWKLVDKRPVRKVVDEAAVIAWAEANAINPYEEPKLKSPAQLEKTYAETAPRGKKAAFEAAAKEALHNAVMAVSSGKALVPVTDDRKPANSITADDFAPIVKVTVVKALTDF